MEKETSKEDFDNPSHYQEGYIWTNAPKGIIAMDNYSY